MNWYLPKEAIDKLPKHPIKWDKEKLKKTRIIKVTVEDDD